VVKLLMETEQPLSVESVAQKIGVHINTARFHLEALVESGHAIRETEVRSQPGRRRVLYTGKETKTPIDPTQGYRLLATILTAEIASGQPATAINMYEVGLEWGRYLTSRPAPHVEVDEDEVGTHIVSKLDEMGFLPEYVTDPEPSLIVHHCPFMEWARHAPHVVCQMNCGIVNGSLEVLRSQRRIVEVNMDLESDVCVARMGSAALSPQSQVPMVRGPVDHLLEGVAA